MLEDFLKAIQTERERQDKKWGPDQVHPDVHPSAVDAYDAAMFSMIPVVQTAKDNCDDDATVGTTNWSTILVEEVSEAVEAAAEKDLEHLYVELVQVASVAAAWARDIKSRI
jgi:hypothetical protein